MTLTDGLLLANIMLTIGFGAAALKAVFLIDKTRARDDAWIGTRVDQIWEKAVADRLTPDEVHQLNSQILAARQRAGLR